ncbi:MAG: transglycosylase domain-containing protein [Bacilli bacterium]|nr:transglycosylase domain-containing protein [Bacilli bacterium]
MEQASQTYFGKSVTDLTLSEAALIAGLFQAPTSYNPFYHPEAATKRRSTVLNLMYRHGYITEEERDAADAIPVTSLLTEKGSGDLPDEIGYIDTVVTDVKEKLQAEYGGKKDDWSPDNLSMNVYTTFDPERQQVINDIYSGKTYKWKNDVAQAGIAVIDVNTGALVAVGAGRNKTNARSWNFAYALRPPGSTAKPVLDYGPAIEYLNWVTGQTIIDDKMTYSGGASIKNFDNGFKGIMTIKQSLAQSRNIPALFTFLQTTNEQKVDFATKLGWTSLETSNGEILESASIGGFEGVSPIQSAAAFATFARGGTYIEPYTFTKIEFTDTGEVYEHTPKKVQAMSEETAYLITNILRYAVTSGTVGVGSVSGTDIAAKTVTTTVGAAAKKALGVKSMIGDVWEVAYSPDYAVSLWYGYKTNTKEYHLTGSEGSAARRAITKLLTKGIMKKNSRFKKPSGVTTVEIELETDPVQLASEFTPKELRSSELFKKGHAPSQVSTRFSKLENPSNLSYTSTSNSVTLSWTPAATPNAINTEYLTDFFNKSNVYKKWADKYLKQRLDYNNANIGSFGYQVFLKNQTGTYDLGFTTNTSFTTNVQFDATTTFIVKSSYQKFKTNQSDGISVSVAPNSSVNNIPQAPQTTTTTEASKLSITYLGPSCSTVDDFKALGSNTKDKILVKENDVDVTSQATVSMDCFLASDPETGGQCNNLVSGNEYIINITVSYKKTNRTKIINLKKSC